MEIKHKAYVYLIASLLIGSFTPVLLVLTQGTNAFELFLLAALISIPIGLALLAKNNKISSLTKLASDKKKLFYIIVAALLLYIPYEYGIAYAEHFISASLATVLFRLNPLLMLLFLPILLKERLSKNQIIALFIAFLGILIGVSQGSISNVIGSPNLIVMLFVVILALGYALANVIIKWQMIDNDIFLSTSTFILTIFFAIAFVGSGFHFVQMSTIDIIIIIYLAITNIFSFYMYLHAFKVLKTTMVTNTFLLSPFLTFVWASLLFSEAIQPYYLVIAVLVGLGMLLQRRDKVGGTYSRSRNRENIFWIFDVTGAFLNTKNRKVLKTMEHGGRIMVIKLENKHKSKLDAIIRSNRYSDILSAKDLNGKEARFVRSTLGADRGDIIVIKAGSIDEADHFFEELSNKIMMTPALVTRR